MKYTVSDEYLKTWEGQTHGWIQWKGTDVCMDLHCECGYLGHIDGMFAYFVKCAKCGAIYEVDGHVKLFRWHGDPKQVEPLIEDETDMT